LFNNIFKPFKRYRIHKKSLKRSVPGHENPLANLINSLASVTDFESRYIEIGVGDGDIFKDIVIGTRIGVGEQIFFNRKKLPAKSQVFQTPISEYLLNCEKNQEFDFVVINTKYVQASNLMTYLELVRTHIHEASVVVIVDSLPYSLKHHLALKLIERNVPLSEIFAAAHRYPKNFAKISLAHQVIANFVKFHTVGSKLMTIVDTGVAITILHPLSKSIQLSDTKNVNQSIHDLFSRNKSEVYNPVTFEIAQSTLLREKHSV
jgi:hypothetical protein